MKTRAGSAAVALTVTGLYLGVGPAWGDRYWTRDQKDEAWRSYIENVEAALGTFNDIHVYQRMPDRWKLVTGKYIPVTQDDKVPDTYKDHMQTDRPMLLPPDILAPLTGEGGGVPYSVVGRMPGSNPEVQWVFLSRHYYITDPGGVENTSRCNSFVCLNDIAVIGHHPRTGATAYFQFYDTEKPKPAPTIVSPWSADGQAFWNDVTWVADINCAKCHSADPFIHSPWISQAKVDLRPGQPYPEMVVPSNPLGPYYIINVEVEGKNIFEDEYRDEDDGSTVSPSWNRYLRHLVAPNNNCTSCHRIPAATSDLASAVQLYARSTLGIGADGYEPDPNQTPAYQALPWMPPIDLAYGDFYAGQKRMYGGGADPVNPDEIRKAYERANGNDVREVNALKSDDPRLRNVPAPPEEYRSVLVDREHRDTIESGKALLVADMRMRASTHAALSQWRFHADPAANSDMRAAPVVLRRIASPTGALQFEVVFVGTPRGASTAGKWVPLSEKGDFAIAQGDHLGLLLINGGTKPAPALVPYSEDDWAEVADMGGANTFPFEIITYRTNLDSVPEPGDRLDGDKLSYRTYSFEFRNRQ